MASCATQINISILYNVRKLGLINVIFCPFTKSKIFRSIKNAVDEEDIGRETEARTVQDAERRGCNSSLLK